MSLVGRRIEIRGTVQGVGFRPWVYRLATEEGVTGRVRNDAAGATIEAFGRPRAVQTASTQADNAAIQSPPRHSLDSYASEVRPFEQGVVGSIPTRPTSPNN